MKAAIRFTNVTKSFFIQEDKTFKDVIPSLILGKGWAKQKEVFHNISFEIKKGESVGIVGKNGAGKSTIMKLIAGVTYPSKGKVKIDGKIAPLIELGAGFHHELSGYENIFLNAAILGMHKRQIELVLEDIIEFSEIGEFINTPIKRYSTGMLMRLAFSIAIHATADIILVDEVLAVGDEGFQRKCLKRLKKLKEDGNKTIVFISHNREQVLDFCERVILLQDGEIAYDGDPRSALRLYKSEDAD